MTEHQQQSFNLQRLRGGYIVTVQPRRVSPLLMDKCHTSLAYCRCGFAYRLANPDAAWRHTWPGRNLVDP